MLTDNEILRMIFGFKVRYLRLQKDLSYHQLSEMTKLSTSYLNDIEKGKKYPKPGKVQALASALGVSYDEMVSTRTTKKLQPIIDLLNSNFFKLFPLEEFGISPEKLLEVFTNAPDKVTAFVGTIFTLGRHYQIGEEQFYQVALRSYQDMHNNHFPELEQAVKDFRKENNVVGTVPYTKKFLEKKLGERYGVSVERRALPQPGKSLSIRSYFSHADKRLLLSEGLSNAQENFLIARELGFQYLDLQERPIVTRILETTSFEKLLNNFKASYFAVALLMDEEELKNDIQEISRKSTWQPELVLGLIKKYGVTQEMFLQRLTNILPHHFGIEDLFFLRLSASEDLKDFRMTKELHLGQSHSPYINELHEHYCRRWVSTRILKELRMLSSKRAKNGGIASAQISKYWETDKEYFCISMGKPATSGKSTSVTIGLLVTPQLRGIFNFLNDPSVIRKEVNTTCERCSMPDCEARVAPPIVIEEQRKREELVERLREL